MFRRVLAPQRGALFGSGARREYLRVPLVPVWAPQILELFVLVVLLSHTLHFRYLLFPKRRQCSLDIIRD
jgi:hypothetical protein